MVEGDWGVLALCDRGAAGTHLAPLSQLAPLLRADQSCDSN